MEYSVVVQSISIISLMIIIGAILSKSFKFSEDTRKVFISLILNVGMPCIILSSIFKVDMNQNTFKMIMIVFCLSIVINVTGIGIGWLFARLFFPKSNKRRELALLAGLGNTSFIGIPLCAVLLGPKGALYAAIFDAGVDVTIWTIGVLMLQKDKSYKINTFKAMLNVPIIAAVLGLTMSYFQYKPPGLVIDLVDQLAAIAAPLAMFYIGILVMSLQLTKIKNDVSQVWLPILIKLVVLPLIVSFFLTFLILDLTIVQTLLIQSMMPTLTLASILFAKYAADENMGATTTVFSILLSLITIPLLIYLMNHFLVAI